MCEIVRSHGKRAKADTISVGNFIISYFSERVNCLCSCRFCSILDFFDVSWYTVLKIQDIESKNYMEKQKIGQVPAVLYGGNTDRACLYIHGKCGYKEEAAGVAAIVEKYGYATLAIDLPGHGERTDCSQALTPWNAVPDIAAAYDWLAARYHTIDLYAVSIGAYFSMLALMHRPIRHAYFESPVLSMVRLISGMMAMNGVTEEELEARGEIPNENGETLSWNYYQYAKRHSLDGWHTETSILWADGDTLTDRDTVESFAAAHHAALHTAEHCEHWFHTEAQLQIRENWQNAVVKTLRRAESADIPAVLSLYEAVKTMPDTTWNAYYPGEAEIEADFSSHGLYVWLDTDGIAGAVSVVETDDLDTLPVFEDDSGTHREICRLVIDPRLQGHGYAVYLLTELFTQLRTAGIDEIRLLVAKCNRAANATYRKLGFSYLGECTMYGVSFYVCRRTL